MPRNNNNYCTNTTTRTSKVNGVSIGTNGVNTTIDKITGMYNDKDFANNYAYKGFGQRKMISQSGRSKKKTNKRKNVKDSSLCNLMEDINDNKLLIADKVDDGIIDNNIMASEEDIKNTSGEMPDEQQGKGELDRIKGSYRLYLALSELYDFKLYNNQLYIYEEKNQVWRLIEEDQKYRGLRRMVPPALKSLTNTNSLREVFEWLMSEEKEVGNVISHRNYLNFRNLAYDWVNDMCIYERKEMFFRYTLTVEAPDNINTLAHDDSEFERYLYHQFGDDMDTRREFLKMVGLALSEIRDLKYAFFIYGPSNTGKSVFFNLLKRIVGSELCSNVSFAQMSDEFAVSKLHGKRINISGEVSGTTNKRLDIFKSLTGNDEVEVRAMYRDFFSLKNECLLLFACNELPAFQDSENFEAIMERIIIFPFFNQVYREEGWIENYDMVLYNDVDSIIRYAVQGLRYLKEDGYCFKESKAMQEIKANYLNEYNSFVVFVKQFIVADSKSKVASQDIQDAYHRFCKVQEVPELYSNQWSKILKQLYPVSVATFGNPRRRGYRGISLKKDEVDNLCGIMHYGEKKDMQ